jgi:hypothetical protein
MVRLDQEWYYMAMRIMKVQIVRLFSAEKWKECVGSMCHMIERMDRQAGLCELLGLQSKPGLLPYHSSLLIIYIEAAMLVFDL